MDGVLPIALSLTDDSARIIGAYVRSGLVDVVRPPLDRIERQLHDLHNAIRVLSIDMVDVFNGVTDRRLKVQVMNEDLLDHIEATRWAVAYFSYNTFLELLEHIRHMRWLDGRSHIHLHDIIAGLGRIESLVAAFATEVGGIGSTIIGLLQAILDQLRQGIGLTGTIQIVVTGADPLANLDLLKLLGLIGLLALGLAVIVAFLYGVGAALATFTAAAIPAAIAIGILVAGLIPLMNALVGFDWEQLGKIAAGFAGIAVFVAALGKAFQQFTSELEKIVPHLKTFFEAISALMSAIAAFDWGQLGKIAAGFAGIAVFVAALGKAFQQFTTDLGTVIPHLNTFFESISKLMSAIAAFDWSQLGRIAVGFAAIAVFVAALGKAFQQFTTDLGAVIPHLNTFFDAITKLMNALAAFDWGQLAKIGVGFLLIAGFVWLLGKALETLSKQAISAIEPLAGFFTAITALMVALAKFTPGEMFQIAIGFILIAGFVWLLSLAINTLTAQSVQALPGLAALIGALSTLASTLGKMTVGEMITMAIGLILIAAFVWAIAAALVYAAGPLSTLASLFESFGTVLSTVSDIAGGLWDVISDIGSGIGDIGSGIGDFFGGIGGSLFGAIDVNAIMGGAGGGTALAAAGRAAAPVATAAGGAAGIGALAPGGALAAAPVGGATTVDQTVNAGGINVSITADRLEADSAQLLTDDIVAQLQARLGALRSTQDFQAGARPAVA